MTLADPASAATPTDPPIGDEPIEAAPWETVPGLLRTLWQVVDDLQDLFPKRKFTLDGHLLGSIGECLAADSYDLDLAPASTRSHDATAPDGRTVEIKLTQGNGSINLSATPKPIPDTLLVFRLVRDGEPELVHNGPAGPAWDKANPPRSNNTRSISLTALRALNKEVEERDRLAKVRDIPLIGKP